VAFPFTSSKVKVVVGSTTGFPKISKGTIVKRAGEPAVVRTLLG